METYKNYKIEKGDFGYYEATSLTDCDANMIFAKSIEDIKRDIDEIY
tara:strand:+ start:2522 stop:2662 length:141 start_codon:yes stop_codon:yes gene_type:complete